MSMVANKEKQKSYIANGLACHTEEQQKKAEDLAGEMLDLYPEGCRFFVTINGKQRSVLIQ